MEDVKNIDDPIFEKIKSNSSDVEDESVSVKEFICYLKSPDKWSISLSELKRIMKKNEVQDDPNFSAVPQLLDKEQISEFTNQIANGKIVISFDLSEVFNFDNGNGGSVESFVKTNTIARKLIYKDIYNQLFSSQTGFFSESKVSNSNILDIDMYKTVAECLKQINIVTQNGNTITLDLSKFKDEFLLSVGVVDFKTLFQSAKGSDPNLTLSDWIQNQEFKISDINFNDFLEFMKSSIEDINSNEFSYWLQKIGASSLNYNNVKEFVSLLLLKKEFKDFNLIKQLIDGNLRPVKDDEARWSYRSVAKAIFSAVCKHAKQPDDALGIILVLDALIRKQDECFQCGKLIDALNEVCVETKLSITQETLANARSLIKNKILVTDRHTNNSGYKFVIDFQSTKEGYLTIPINVKYLNKNKNKEVNTALTQYIIDKVDIKQNANVDKLNCQCDINNKKSFDNIISQIKGWFNDKGGKASQEVKDINKKFGEIDGSDDNLMYILKSKCEPLKLELKTLQTILNKIFNDKNKINNEGVFFKKFGPWFCHVLSNYLDFTSVGYNDLCTLMDECLDKSLKFQLGSVNELIDFLKKCIKATKKNNRSCVDLSFMATIFDHIDLNSKSDISEMFPMFDFICDNAYQMKVDEENTAERLNQLVSHMVLRILKFQTGLKDKEILIKKLTDQLNKKCFCGLVQAPKSHSISVASGEKLELTGKENACMDIRTIRIEVGENGFINKIYASTCQMSGANDISVEPNDENSITLFKSSNEKLVNNNYKETIEKSYEEQKLKTKEALEKESKIKQQDTENTEEAKKIWNAQKNAQKQAADQNNQSFLLEEVKNEFDNAFTKAFGNLNEGEQIENYDKLGDFLKNVQKIWDLVEICRSREDLKDSLKGKIETFFKSQIRKKSLTLEQIVQLVNLKYSSVWKNCSIKIDGFLKDWCGPYLNAVNDFQYALPNKIKIEDPILDTLEVFDFVVSKKEITTKGDAQAEIAKFLNSQLFEKAFDKYKNEYNLDESKIKEKISEVVIKLTNRCNNGNKVESGKIRNDMEDMFFQYLNNNFKDKYNNLHIKTHAEKMDEQKAAKEKEEKIKQNQSDKLLENIKAFTKIDKKDLTRESVKNISKDVDLKNIKLNLTENAINDFMNLLKQVNEKVKSIEEQEQENQNLEQENQNLEQENQNLEQENQNLEQENQNLEQENQNLGAVDFTQELANLQKLFGKGSLTKDQFKIFTVFIASMQYYITGNKLSFMDFESLCKNLLAHNEMLINEYLTIVFKTYDSSNLIVFENALHLSNFIFDINDLNFKQGEKQGEKQGVIIDLVNKYSMFQKALYDECISNGCFVWNEKGDKDIGAQITDIVKKRWNGDFDEWTNEGSEIYISDGKFYYSGNEKKTTTEDEINKFIKNNVMWFAERLSNDLRVEAKFRQKTKEYLEHQNKNTTFSLPKILLAIVIILAVLAVIALLNGVGVFGAAVLIPKSGSLVIGVVSVLVDIVVAYFFYKANQVQTDQKPPGLGGGKLKLETEKNIKDIMEDMDITKNKFAKNIGNEEGKNNEQPVEPDNTI